jgi:hypothetical protein
MAIALVALGLPLAACSSSGGPSASAGLTPAPNPTGSTLATLPSACAILGLDQIEAATGIVAAAGTLNRKLSTAGTSVCDWKPETADSPSIEVLITFATNGAPTVAASPTKAPAPVISPAPGASAEANPIAAQRAAAEATMGAATDIKLAGGTNAFTLNHGSVVGMNLTITKKAVKTSYYIQVTYTSGDTTDVSATTKALASLVATSF